MRSAKLLGLAAILSGGGYAAVQIANAIIRRYEDVDPDAIERPGSMAFVDGVGFHYVERGSGPAVLLIHGFGGSSLNFRHLIDRLAAHCHVIAVDLPGFGYSDRPTTDDLSHTARAERLSAFMDRLGIPSATVIGHSMGGAIAMRLAAAHPERVERLVLVGASPPDKRFALPLYRFVRPLLPLAAAFLLRNPGIIRREVRKVVYDPAFITDARWREYTQPTRVRGHIASLLKMIDDVRHDAPLDPASVPHRTLLLWGEADTDAPLSVAHRLHAVMPDARLEVVPRAGHLVLEERPEVANEIVLRFLLGAGARQTAAS